MKDLSIEFDNIPDEILIYIFQKLYNVDALYLLIGVNQRLNRIVHDPIFTSHLSLLRYCPDRNVYDPLPDPILDRFCSTILLEIGHHVKSLSLEATSMKRILHATSYPNLQELALFDINVEQAKSIFVDENSKMLLMKNQISSFSIKFASKNKPEKHLYPFILTQIFAIFSDLKCLKFNPSSFCRSNLCFDMSPLTVISSSLVELHISVYDINDCFYLFDGRFNQLRALYVSLSDISSHLQNIDKEKLSANLRIFSLQCGDFTDEYDGAIFPLARRMVNLEELHLTLVVVFSQKLIDVNALKIDFTSRMPALHKFTFNIYSMINHYDPTNLPSNEVIYRTFEYFYGNPVVTCIDHFQERIASQCHIYSYPYQWEYYDSITNNFPGGLFKSVTNVSLYDEQPFEYEFFLRIGKSFPFMKSLSITNEKAQNDKHLTTATKDSQPLSIINYPNLTELGLSFCHDDYVELFLLHTKVYLPNDVNLGVRCESLKKITYNFTRNETRNNCQKLRSVYLSPYMQVTEHVRNYFPYSKIL